MTYWSCSLLLYSCKVVTKSLSSRESESLVTEHTWTETCKILTNMTGWQLSSMWVDVLGEDPWAWMCSGMDGVHEVFSTSPVFGSGFDKLRKGGLFAPGQVRRQGQRSLWSFPSRCRKNIQEKGTSTNHSFNTEIPHWNHKTLSAQNSWTQEKRILSHKSYL